MPFIDMVYVLFTKADLLAGFVEFFDDLGREGREQVWGVTFPAVKQAEDGTVIDTYPAEFDALIGRLNDRAIERLQQEADIQRRALIFGFPQQIATLKELTDGFLREIFEPNRYQKPARLRGVYFTSGTQLGTPIDRLMGAMAASFGISRQQMPAFSGTGRSYFLTRLMRDVIFGEANLVSADTKVEMHKHICQNCGSVIRSDVDFMEDGSEEDLETGPCALCRLGTAIDELGKNGLAVHPPSFWLAVATATATGVLLAHFILWLLR